MAVDASAFRAYDIRGRVDASITEDLAFRLGRAFGTHIAAREGAARPRVAVGRDNRASSERLADALQRGLRASGCDVCELGLSTSPLLYFACAKFDLTGGINVTGSHNPLDENGFKLVGRGARPVAGEELQELYRLAAGESFSSGSGTVSTLSPAEAYFEHLRQQSEITKPFNVVTDTGNAVAGLFVPRFLEEAGCRVDALYVDLDPAFPNHLPDPQMPENVVGLQRRVREVGADVGLAFDGDGDRLGVVDDRAARHEADYILMLLARDLLRRQPGARILLDVKTSQAVIDDIRGRGGDPVLSRTGHSLIKLRMRAEAVPLAGENSGHIFYQQNYYGDDGLFAACKLLSFLGTVDGPLSRQFDDVPEWHSTPEIRRFCRDGAKAAVVAAVAAVLRERYPADETDGIRVTFPAGWALVRASNTGPNLTMRFEARSLAALEEIRDQVMTLVEREVRAAGADEPE